MARLSAEHGDVILAGLLKTVAGLLILGVVLFDTGAVIVNHVQLDDVARTASRAGAVMLAADPSTRAVEQAVVRRLATQTGISLLELTVDRGRVAVTVARPARVLLLHRLGPLATYANGSATAAAVSRGR